MHTPTAQTTVHLALKSKRTKHNKMIYAPNNKGKYEEEHKMTQQIITTEERKALIYNMSKLLDEYEYAYELDALSFIVDTWAEQKQELISAFKKHSNYVEGEFMIAFDSNYERTLDKNAVKSFRNWLLHIVTYHSDGYDGSLPTYIKERRTNSEILPQDLYDFIVMLDTHITERTISEDLVKMLGDIVPEVHAHCGEKTSRVINKLCTYLGYNKHPDYNREFAKFADGLSPLTIKRHTVLSLNPLDYLTMSFGNSWASCHTIDKYNKRGMLDSYSGCYSSGTISYMLDSTSMVLYTVDAKYDGKDYWTQPKIVRQMFHYGADKLIQGRLYPKDNDGDNDAYAPYRNIVQQIISTIFDFPNLWTLSRGTSAISDYVWSYGTHYRDYSHFDSCTISKKSGTVNEDKICIGHEPICIECGEEHSTENSINCCSESYHCEHCGREISDDESRWVGDYRYCENCVGYCDECEYYYFIDDVRYVESTERYVCDGCLDDLYICCGECGEYYRDGCTTYVESANIDVCEDCLERHYTYCDECEEYFRNEDITYIDHLCVSVCEDCLADHFTKCDECGKHYPNDEINELDDDRHICDECYDKENEEDEVC